MSDPHDLLTSPEVAEWLRVPVRTLEYWRTERKGPRFARIGREVRYRRCDVQAYLDEQFGAWDTWQAS